MSQQSNEHADAMPGTRPAGSPGRALKRIFRQDDILRKIQPQEASMSLLMNPVRREIFLELCRRPCTHARELARKLDMGQTAVLWHLGRLEKAGYVESMPDGNRKVFWPAGMVLPDDVPVIAALLRPHAVSVIRVLAAADREKGMTEAGIVKALGRSQQVVHGWLEGLVSAGVLERNGTGRGALYSVSGSIARMSGEYDDRAREFSRVLEEILRNDGLMPSGRRFRGTRLSIRVKLPGGQMAKLHVECSPTAGIRRYLG